MVTVLVPGRFLAVASGFAKHMSAPKDDVWPYELLHHVQDFWLHCQVEKVLTALHAFSIGLVALAHHMSAHQLFGTDPRIFTNQLIERCTQSVYALLLQRESRDQTTAFVIFCNIFLSLCGHRFVFSCEQC